MNTGNSVSKKYTNDLAIWTATTDIRDKLQNKTQWQTRTCVLVNLHQYFPRCSGITLISSNNTYYFILNVHLKRKQFTLKPVLKSLWFIKGIKLNKSPFKKVTWCKVIADKIIPK